MYGLEYALFFGVPSNKIELISGRSRWSFPFADRGEAEAHFESWRETLSRWKQAPATPVERASRRWQTTVAGVNMELYPGPVSVTFPIAWQAFEAFLHTFNRRDFWPGQPKGLDSGWDSFWDFGDIRLNLWKLLDDMSKRHKGKHGCRTDIAISDSASVAPSACYFRSGRRDIMLADYFGAAPDLVGEVLFAPSRFLDRGQRMDIYRRCGVENLLLVEPALETVEVYKLAAKNFQRQETYGAGSSFALDLFPGETIAVDDLFATQSKRWEKPSTSEVADKPISAWLLPPEFKIGLEYFFHLGHPERRWEFWNNRAHSVLAFGSVEEAKARLDYFLTEICQWESASRPRIATLASDAEQVEVGRFQLTRQGRLVSLHIAVDGQLYKRLLQTWCDNSAWDWGEENVSIPDSAKE